MHKTGPIAAAEYVRRTKLSKTQGSNIITKTICSDRGKVIELGKIKVDIMNRFPYPLDISSWAVHEAASAKAAVGAQPSHARKYVDTVSVITWNLRHHTELELSKMGVMKNGNLESVWTKSRYGSGHVQALRLEGKAGLRHGGPKGVWAHLGSKDRKITKLAAEDSLKLEVSILVNGLDMDRISRLPDLKDLHVFTLDHHDDPDTTKGLLFACANVFCPD
ncbi:hypothetical protein C7974DRAFT_453278 [Boeremia exigua]|uniref:uncharacterized protein n=1 Tax=Boeremia exigua TaxID=749465 RepID=UPI001E8EA236|nr:uncharacterized protein C7974DRAFT_453278 [Boeremia exigua]KAH6633736.1 hypothetical protein C7974DRAFT_453278 [Boeremia exigua]